MSPFAPGAGAPTGRGWDWFCCRSTAHGANGVGTHSHPGRVLLRGGGGLGFAVGAPPRCEPGGHPFAPEAGAPTVRGWVWVCCRSTGSVGTGLRGGGGGVGFAVGAPPRCEPGGHPFAPEAGAPTVRGWVWFCCRSTASVRTGPAQSTPRAAPPSHPGRVLLRVGVGIGFCC